LYNSRKPLRVKKLPFIGFLARAKYFANLVFTFMVDKRNFNNFENLDSG